MIKDVRAALRECADESDAKLLQGFFKTAPGEYGEGDKFIGIRVPATRGVAGRFQNLDMSDTLVLLRSEIHEERLLALIILAQKYKKGAPGEKSDIYREYLANTQYINNWDLVDVSADRVVGAHLMEKPRDPLFGLARSVSLWERRIAIMSTFHFIRCGDFDDTLKIAGMLLADREDLIHKAVGWMLREVGKRDLNIEESFLRKHYRNMPRTMLRYAIEKFPETIRKQYLQGKI
ncbi:MAG TPA: DNA alkylation repair protein [Lentisphaeria bacterium]|nr:DNA alkylation repair protein [Lentisphaeria bacterium]